MTAAAWPACYEIWTSAMPKPMRVYYDFEFREEYGRVEPISLGMVRDDDKELYIVFNDFNTLAVARDPWLMQNVMSSIPHTEVTSHVTGTGTPVKDIRLDHTEDLMDKTRARWTILQFLEDIWPEFWAWYGAYDHVALCSIFGRMVDLPVKFPMFTHDLKQWHKELGQPRNMPVQEKGKHNALDDARHNKVRWYFMAEKLGRLDD